MSLAVLSALVLIVSGCEPGGEPIIENQTDQDVSIYITDVLSDGTLGEQIDYGVVLAHSTKQIASIVFIKPEWVYRIQAINPSGEVVFSQDYNYYDLEEISWKITIPP